MAPTVFQGVTPAMRVWREEIFGPVLSVATFRTEAEAIAMANDSEYGLAGGCTASQLTFAPYCAQQVSVRIGMTSAARERHLGAALCRGGKTPSKSSTSRASAKAVAPAQLRPVPVPAQLQHTQCCNMPVLYDGKFLHCPRPAPLPFDSALLPRYPPGAVISADLERCRRVSEALECGITWINCSQPCFCYVSGGHVAGVHTHVQLHRTASFRPPTSGQSSEIRSRLPRLRSIPSRCSPVETLSRPARVFLPP